MMSTPRVALFVTCLVDFYRPSVAFAALRLLEQVGCEIFVPEAQTCCGQPAFNQGDVATAQALAQQVIEHFQNYDYVVLPSGSCAGMMRIHYPELFNNNAVMTEKVAAFAAKCYELTDFLNRQGWLPATSESYSETVTYHDSCSGLRELGIKAQPRHLLNLVGVNVKEMENTDVCCGFGGTFCVKYSDISTRLVTDKVSDIEASGAMTLSGGDLGCLLNIAGRLKRLAKPIKVYHVAEILAGSAIDTPSI